MARKVPMIILPPGVDNQVETNVLMINATVMYHETAREHVADDITVENVRVVGTAAEPGAYIVETAREGGIAMPLTRVLLVEEAIATARQEFAIATTELSRVAARDKLHDRLAEIFLPEELR